MEILEIEGQIRTYVTGLHLEERVVGHPYLAIAAAAGLGFVVAGGLTTRLARRLAGFGLRRVVLPIVLERLLAREVQGGPVRGEALAGAA